MGNETSTVSLIPQLEPITATQPRFILKHGVTIHLSPKLFSASGDDFKITCAKTGVDFFKCKGKLMSLREKKTLQDYVGTPVVNLKNKHILSRAIHEVYAGNSSDKLICKIETALTFSKIKMTTVFKDVVTGKTHHIVMKMDWRAKRGNIFLGEPKQGGLPIAKLIRPATGRGMCCGMNDYYLEIAPGVDVALMVCMGLAMAKYTGL